MLKELLSRYPCLKNCEQQIEQAANILIDCFTAKNKLLTCGNGGSSADADHIVGELMKGFLKKRPLCEEKRNEMQAACPELDSSVLDNLQEGLPALSLCTLIALNTAFCNDVEPELIYAQSLIGIGRKGDVLLCISTSGNAKNVCEAAKVAKALGITVISLSGANGGKLKELSDVCIQVPETETFKVQELHLPIYHYLCAKTEAHFFPV